MSNIGKLFSEWFDAVRVDFAGFFLRIVKVDRAEFEVEVVRIRKSIEK
jgi:hypothetical protein